MNKLTYMPSWLGGDLSPWLRRVGCNRSSKKPNATFIYPAISLMSRALSTLLKPTYSVTFCLIHTMFCTNYYHQKRSLVITCRNIRTTLPSSNTQLHAQKKIDV